MEDLTKNLLDLRKLNALVDEKRENLLPQAKEK
jgi:hypothetical protein